MFALASAVAGASAASQEVGAGAHFVVVLPQHHHYNDPEEEWVHKFVCANGSVHDFDDVTTWWQTCHAEDSYIVECPSMFPVGPCAFQSGGPTACVQIVEDCPLGQLLDLGMGMEATGIRVKAGEYINTQFPPLSFNQDCGGIIRMDVHEYQCASGPDRYNMTFADVDAWQGCKDDEIEHCPPHFPYRCHDQSGENIKCAQNPLICYNSQERKPCPDEPSHPVWSWIYYGTDIPGDVVRPRKWDDLEIIYDSEFPEPSRRSENPFESAVPTDCEYGVFNNKCLKKQTQPFVAKTTNLLIPIKEHDLPVTIVAWTGSAKCQAVNSFGYFLKPGSSEVTNLFECGRSTSKNPDDGIDIANININGTDRHGFTATAFRTDNSPENQVGNKFTFSTTPQLPKENGECPTQKEAIFPGCGAPANDERRRLQVNADGTFTLSVDVLPPLPLVAPPTFIAAPGAAATVGLLPLWIALGILLLLLLLAMFGFAAAKKQKPAVFREDIDHRVAVASYGGNMDMVMAVYEEEDDDAAPTKHNPKALE